VEHPEEVPEPAIDQLPGRLVQLDHAGPDCAITAAGLKIRALCLDREFYARKVIEFLKTVQVPFILPVRKHSRAMKRLRFGICSGMFEYTMRGKPALRLTIAVVVLYAKGKRGKHGAENLGYIVDGVPWNPRKIHETYRSRFAIESSYRMRNQVKARTPTRNPVIRYLFAIISFLLRNLWLAVLRTWLCPEKRGLKTIEIRGSDSTSSVSFLGKARSALRIICMIPALRSHG